jgi:O-methyltransferase involved in polyketide biosynthesis
VPGVCNFVDARTKWLDSALKAALDSGVRQVCCIAAGYDTRAYRFCRQGVKVGAQIARCTHLTGLAQPD